MFVDTGPVDYFIPEQESKNIQRDVKLVQGFLETENEIRKVEDFPATELNGHLREFSLHCLMSVVIIV